jgi:hypothetical protein
MSVLPFVVQPKRKPILEQIGSDESGKIEVERRGYLTTGERSFVQQVQQADNGTTEIVTLSRRVSRAHGVGMDKAYNLVLQAVSGVTAESPKDQELVAQIEQEFTEDLTSVVKGLAAASVREELVFAACLIKYRIDSDFDISSVSEIHPDIISGLAALYRDEERRSVEAFNVLGGDDGEAAKQQPSIEEVEKKPVKATSSRSRSTTGD